MDRRRDGAVEPAVAAAPAPVLPTIAGAALMRAGGAGADTARARSDAVGAGDRGGVGGWGTVHRSGRRGGAGRDETGDGEEDQPTGWGSRFMGSRAQNEHKE